MTIQVFIDKNTYTLSSHENLPMLDHNLQNNILKDPSAPLPGQYSGEATILCSNFKNKSY